MSSYVNFNKRKENHRWVNSYYHDDDEDVDETKKRQTFKSNIKQQICKKHSNS